MKTKSEFAILVFHVLFTPIIALRKFDSYVFNGEDVDIKYVPFSAYLLISCSRHGTFTCGGSILTADILLTAAHCVEDCAHPSVSVYVGHAVQKKGHLRTVSNFKMHENYDEEKIINDIAILLLDKSLNFNKFVSRIAIFPNRTNADSGYTAGWGIINENGQKPRSLQGVKQKIWTREQCQKYLGSSVSKGTICGGEYRINKGVAQGDSGSPLVVEGYIQVGIVSYKLEKSRSLAVYTEIRYFYHWIKTTSKKLYCKQKKGRKWFPLNG